MSKQCHALIPRDLHCLLSAVFFADGTGGPIARRLLRRSPGEGNSLQRKQDCLDLTLEGAYRCHRTRSCSQV